MKNKILFFTVLISTSSLDCWSQQYSVSLNEKKAHIQKNTVLETQDNILTKKKIKHYHVEETVTLKFGGHKRIYDVTNYKMIETYDLGPNGKRTITPIYSDKIEEQQSQQHKNQQHNQYQSNTTSGSNNLNSKTARPTNFNSNKKSVLNTSVVNKETDRDRNKIEINIDKSVSKKTTQELESQTATPTQTVPINEIKTNNDITKIEISNTPKYKDFYKHYVDEVKIYERVVEKGYGTVSMLKRMGDIYFFNDNYDIAKKCYEKLFSITKDIEPEYYYRYSIILKSKGETQKSDEYLKKYNQLSKVD